MPSLLSLTHELIESETNAFFWADDSGRLAGFLPEYVIPDVVDALAGNFENLLHRTLPMNFTATMRSGAPVGNLAPAFNADFYRTDLYHLVYRPYNLHHAIDGVVRDDSGGIGKGAFVLARSARQPPFGAAEKNMLMRLTPYLAHALPERGEGAQADFADSGEAGMVILDQAGKVAYVSERARQILYFATHPDLLPPPARCDMAVALPPALAALRDNLTRIFEDKAAPPPVIHHQNAWGKFIFRAYWLEATAGPGGMIGVTAQHQQPLPIVMMDKMRAAKLSARQKEVCLLLGNNQSLEAIAGRMHISRATVKDYVERIYRKLDVHTSDELLQKLR